MSIYRKFKRNNLKDNNSKIRAAALATTIFSLFAAPYHVEARSNVLGVQANKVADTTVITDVGTNKIDVESKNIVNNVAVNVFDKFTVQNAETANLYFGQKNNNNADKLFNFVNERINVNGMVNAIRKNQIGGELYFLSKEGMVVGASGIINTGSLHVMTPAATNPLEMIVNGSDKHSYSYEKLASIFASGTHNDNLINNVAKANIPLNPDGTISVLGTINAINNVSLHAPKVAIGKDLNNVDATIVTNAAITTGVTDFRDLVKVDGTSAVDSGIGLEVTRDLNTGDIIIGAKAEYENTKHQITENIQKAFGSNIDIPKSITASVESYGTLTAAGDVQITAEATNGNKDLAEDILDSNTGIGVMNPEWIPVPAQDSNRFAVTEAKINIQGDITAQKDVDIEAKADNTFVDGAGLASTPGIGVVTSILGSTVANLDANVMMLGNEASVNIGQDADIFADGHVNIDATANLDSTLGTSVIGSKTVSLTNVIPSAAVSYAEVENKATVTIDGDITANGNNLKDGEKALSITANAVEKLRNTAANASSRNMMTAASPEVLITSVTLTDGKNNAEVNINDNSQIKVTNDNAEVRADAYELLAISATANASDYSMGSAAINLMKHESGAVVDINGDITVSDGSLDIHAQNTVDENTVTANNSIGMSKIKAAVMNATNVSGIANAAKGALTGTIANSGLSLGGGGGLGNFAKIAKGLNLDTTLFSAGASLVLMDEVNNAKVNVDNTANLFANNDLTIDANTVVKDMHINATSKASSYLNSAKKNATVAAGVVYAEMDNSAEVNIANGDATNHASIAANGNVNITSASTIEYNRPARLFREIERSIMQLRYAVEALENLDEIKQGQYQDVKDDIKGILDSLENYQKSYENDAIYHFNNPEDITVGTFFSKLTEAPGAALGIMQQTTTLQNSVNDLLDVTSPVFAVVSNALGVVSNAFAMIDPASYATVTAGATARGSDTNFAAAGSVAYTDMSANAKVNIGKYADIDAGKKVTFEVNNDIKDVVITGKQKFWSTSANSDGVGVGGSFNYQIFDTDANITIGEGVDVNAGAIDALADSKIKHISAMLNAGKTDGVSLNGMVTYIDSDSKNTINIDDDVVLVANKDNNDVDNNDVEKNGKINIKATNNTDVINAILSATLGTGNAAVGAGVGINDINVENIASISNLDEEKDEDGNVINKKSQGSINASDLNIEAETTGMLHAVGVAGGVSKSGESSEPGFFDKVKDITGITKLTNKKDEALTKVNDLSNTIIDKFNSVGGTEQKGGSKGAETQNQKNSGFSLTAQGSVAANIVNDTTVAEIDANGMHINMKDNADINIEARDTAYIGAYAGGAAISYRSGSGGGTSVAMSGAVGMNMIDNEIRASLNGTTINDADTITVNALSGGTQVAAGLGATVTAGGGQGATAIGGAADVSLNMIEKDVTAEMVNTNSRNTVANSTNKADIDVAAYEADLQITGGVGAAVAIGGGQNASGSGAVAIVSNDVTAKIENGKYENISDMDVQSLLATTQVNAAVSLGISAGGGSTNNSLNGVVIYNDLNNKLDAGIKGATITADTVDVIAQDIDTNNDYHLKLKDEFDANKAHAEDSGIDTDGSSFYKDSENGLDMSITADSDAGTQEVSLDSRGGSTIVNAAFTVAGTSGNAVGAAVNISDIDNQFATTVEGANITANTINAGADANTLLVNAAGGIAVGAQTLGGMGTATWQELNNDVTSAIQNSTLTANAVNNLVTNDSLAVNVGGQVAVGKTAGIGAVLAYNNLDNTTGSYLYGNDIFAKDANTGVDVTVNTQNESDVYGIGASVAASGTVAVSGTVAINEGVNNTEAVVDSKKTDENTNIVNGTITNADDITITATDTAERMAIVGNVAASGKVAVGAGVAINEIGKLGDADKRQVTRAALNHTDITTANTSDIAQIKVDANDTSKLITIGIGVGGSGNVAVQGAAATALVSKDVTAEMIGSYVDKDDDTIHNADVIVTADSETDIVTNASVIALSIGGGGAGVGAAVSVNTLDQDTKINIEDGNYNVHDFIATAKSEADVLNIGVGGAAAGGSAGVSVAGNVSVNLLENDTITQFSDVDINASGNVAALADSKEELMNVLGTLSVGAGNAGVGIGMSVSYNELFGDTKAIIDQNSNISALANGNESISFNGKNYSGLVVGAEADHDLESIVITAGVGAGAASVSVAGTVDINNIKGKTSAEVLNSNINNANSGDVNVLADDYTDIDNILGSASIAAGKAAVSAGGGADDNTLNRIVEAKIIGDEDNKNTLNANKLNVTANNVQEITSIAAGASLAAGIAGGAVTGIVSLVDMDSKTNAEVSNVNGINNGMIIAADHNADIDLLGVAAAAAITIGGAAGAGVSVVNDDSITTATLSDAKIQHNVADAVDSVTAHTKTDIYTEVISVSLSSAAAAAGSVTVNNYNNIVQANVIDSEIGKVFDNTTNTLQGNEATKFTASAENELVNKYTMAAASAALGVGVAASVGVNTIDTTVVTNVSNSDIYAADVDISANENRNIDQDAYSNAVGMWGSMTANILVNNIGTAVEDIYSTEYKDADGNVQKETIDTGLNAKLDEASKNSDAAKNALNDFGLFKDAKTASGVTGNAGSVVVGKGGVKSDGSTAEGVQVKVNTSSNITSSDTVDIKAGATTDASVFSEQASLSLTGIAGNVGVGILNVERKSVIDVNGNIDANGYVNIHSDQAGTAKLEIYQGSGGLTAAMNAAYAGVNLDGNNNISVLGSVQGGEVNITTADTSALDIDTIGISVAGGVSAGGLYANADNTASSTITVNADITATNGDINIEARRGVSEAIMQVAQQKYDDKLDLTKNIVLKAANDAYLAAQAAYSSNSSTENAQALEEARNLLADLQREAEKEAAEAKLRYLSENAANIDVSVTPVSAAIGAAITGFGATLDDNSESNVVIGSDKIFKGQDVNINAVNTSVNKADSITVNVGGALAGGSSVIMANSEAKATVTVGTNNSFIVSDTTDADGKVTYGTTNIGAQTNAFNDVEMEAVSVAYGGALAGNAAVAEAKTTVTVDVGSNKYHGNVAINGTSDILQDVDAMGVTGAVWFASGTNIGKMNASENVTVTAGGGTAAVIGQNTDGSNILGKLNQVDVDAFGRITNLAHTEGYGGGIVNVSPFAAWTQNDIISNTAANIKGTWKVDGDMNVNAVHDNVLDLETDALQAAVANLSGVQAINNVENETAVNYKGANVTTIGDHNIMARNDISYANDTQGSGYGAASGAAIIANDTLNLNSNVTFVNSNIDSKQAINVNALTGDATAGYERPTAGVDKFVEVRAAGAVAGTFAYSNDNIDYINTIEVDNGSELKTTGTDVNNSNINLTAANRSNYVNETVANTQGGAAGAAWTEFDNNYLTNNSININGIVDANYDVNLDAGASTSNNITLKSNAYNKTALPLLSVPRLDAKIADASSVTIGQGANVKAFRDINVAAEAGDTTIVKQAQTWRWIDGGITGTASLSSTSDGTVGGAMTLDNTVIIDGNVLAGKNHQLEIEITESADQKTALNTVMQGYMTGIDLSELEQEVTDAQTEYNNNTDVQSLVAKQQELENKEADLEVYKQLVEDSGNLGRWVQSAKDTMDSKETTLNSVKTEVNTAYTTYKSQTNTSYNGSEADFITDILPTQNSDLNKRLKEAQDAYDSAKSTYDSRVERKANESTTALLDIYTGKYTSVATLESDISTLKGEITTLQQFDSVVDAKTALHDAQANYETALAEGINANVINNHVFKDKEDDYVTVTASEWYQDLYGDAYKNIGFKDYAAALFTRLEELQTVQQEYHGTDVGSAYGAELTRIYQELQALGLARYDSTSGQYMIFTDGSTVPTIDLKNLMVSGGNVNISTGSMSGSGNITANSNPTLTITNSSDFFLAVNNITVDSDGGYVRLNDAATNSKHNGITVVAANNNEVASGGNNAQVTIINNTTTRASESDKYTPDIGVYGTISNPYGNISITNSHNSIYVAGTTDTSEGGTIRGRTINLTAGGAITQGYSDDIYNVFGDPQYAVNQADLIQIQKKLIAEIQNDGNNLTGTAEYYTAYADVNKLAEFIQTVEKADGGMYNANEAMALAKLLVGEAQSEKPGIAAAGAIYINAASINVNGTLQSGYEDYRLNINQTKANDLMNATTTETSEADSHYMNDTYLVTDGGSGAVYDATAGRFVYNVCAWYNPVTKQIFTEDIEQAGGGRIYLAGAIANTNTQGGKLVVLDGGANYELDGSVTGRAADYDFKVGSINADTVSGMITINDTNTGKTTIYTDGKMIVGDVETNVDLHQGTTYQPQEGQYMWWTTGEQSRVITSYKHVSDSSWFGLKNDDWENKVSQANEVTKRQWQDGESLTLDGEQTSQGHVINNVDADGTYFSTFGSTSSTDGAAYQISVDRRAEMVQGNNSAGQPLFWDTVDGKDILTTTDTGRKYMVYKTEISDRATKTKKKGLFGWWGKTVTTTWKETKGMLTAYNFGLQADHGINVQFIGNETGSIGNIESNSDIILSGDMRFGEISINSTAGSINSINDATIISDNVTLDAAKNITVAQQGVNKYLTLNADSNNGIIDITAKAGINTGDVYVKNVNAGKGNVILTVEGNIVATAPPEPTARRMMLRSASNGVTGNVVGETITLTSLGGSIGEAGNALKIDAGTGGVNATAENDIYLTQIANGETTITKNGNMYIGEIVSNNGDVVLEVQSATAGFVDAFTDNRKVSGTDQDRIDSWNKMGLLADGVANQQAQLDNLIQSANSGSVFMPEYDSTQKPTQEEIDAAIAQGQALATMGSEFASAVRTQRENLNAKQDTLNAKQGALNVAINSMNETGNTTSYENALNDYNKAYSEYSAAAEAYQKAKDDFIDSKGFTGNDAATNWLNDYETTANASPDSFGWTKQQLLYAVQDSVINPQAGSISDVQVANVTANNITFVSNSGNIGVADTQETRIGTQELTNMFTSKTDLSDEQEGLLNKLAMARSGDVTWGDEQVVIKRTTPVSIKLNGNDGKVSVQTTGSDLPEQIYLIAKDSKLTADQLAANDLRLFAHNGIDVDSIEGNNIILEGGYGNIDGGLDSNNALKAMQVTLAGNNPVINVNAAGNIWLQQETNNVNANNEAVNFVVGSMAAENIILDANGNIVSQAGEIGYINASNEIDLISEKGIGSADSGLRIRNSGAVVNTDVKGAIYIDAKQDGTLVLGELDQNNVAANINVQSEGSILVGRLDDPKTNDDNEYALGVIDSQGDVTLHATNDIQINGKVHVKANAEDKPSDNGRLNLQSDNGNIDQTTTDSDKNIVVNAIAIAAIGGDVNINNQYNIIGNVDLQAVGGSLSMTVANPDGLTLNMGGFSNMKGGDINFTNSAGYININTNEILAQPANINGTLNIKAKTNINNTGDLNASQDINFTAQTGNIDNQGNLKADDTVTLLAEKGNVVSTGTNDGVNGNDVIVRAISQELANIVAGNSVTLEGDQIRVRRITQRTPENGGNGNLKLRVTALDGTSANSVTLEQVTANNKVQATRIWSQEANVNVTNHLFDIEQLSIGNRGTFTNDETEVVVYGANPVRGNADVYFWYNPDNRNPWMYLNFISGKQKVDSNGTLLLNQDYWYVYDQRFSGHDFMFAELSRQMDGEFMQNFYELHESAIIYAPFDRYNLFDITPPKPITVNSIIYDDEEEVFGLI